MVFKLPTLNKAFGIIIIISLLGLTIFYLLGGNKNSNQLSIIQSNKKETASIKMPQMWNQVCVNCHSLHGEGGDLGPALDFIGDKYTREYLYGWLKDPSKIKHKTLMPNFELTDLELNEIVTFLSQLKKESI